MSKPTLVQTILNRPSQTYASAPAPSPPKRDLHSTRQDMLRIAALEAQHQLNARAPVQRSTPPPQPIIHSPTPVVAPRSSGMGAERTQLPAPASSSTPTSTPSRSTTTPSRTSPAPATPTQHTPRPTSRPSSASSASKRTPVANPAPAPQPPLPQPPTSRVQRLSYPDRVLESDSEGDQSNLDNFFTPPTSPRASMASSTATILFPTGSTSRKPSRKSLRSATGDGHRLSGNMSPVDTRPSSTTSSSLNPNNRSPAIPSPPFPVAIPSTRTPSNSSDRTRALHTLSASSLSSTSLDAHSYISDWLAAGESTFGTTPRQSDSSNNQDVTHSKRSRTSASSSATAAAATATVTPKTKPSQSSSSSSKPKPSSSSSTGPTNGVPHRSSSQKATETAVRSTTTSTNSALVSSGSKSRHAEATKDRDPKRSAGASSSSGPDPHSRGGSGSSGSGNGNATQSRSNGPSPSASSSSVVAADSRTTSRATVTPIVPSSTSTPPIATASTAPTSMPSMKNDPRQANGHHVSSTKTPIGNGGGTASGSGSSGSGIGGSGVAIPAPIPSRHHTFSAFAPLATSSPRTSVLPGAGGGNSAPATTKASQLPSPPPPLPSTSTSMSSSNSSKNLQRQQQPVPRTNSPGHNKLPGPQSPPNTKNSPYSTSTSSPSPSSPSSASPPTSQYVTQYRQTPPPKPPSNFMIMMANNNMDAVLEEDEDAPFTPRMDDKDAPWTEGGPQQRTLRHTSGSKSRNKMSNSPGSGGGSTTPKNQGSAEKMRRRRSRSLDSFDSHADSSFSSSVVSGGAAGAGSNGGGMGSGGSGSGSASTIRKPPQTLSAEVQAMSFSRPGDIPSKGTQGYSSLVLPRAPPPVTSDRSGKVGGSGKGSGLMEGWSKWLSSVTAMSDGKVDLTRTGLAQTTMATVEVVRGLGAVVAAKKTPLVGAVLGNVLNGVRRRASSGPATASANLPKVSASTNPKAGAAKESLLASAEGSILGFTSHRKPPTYVPNGSVLVQVWAVGVDEVDGRLVGVRFAPFTTPTTTTSVKTGPLTDAPQVDEPDEMVYHSHPGPAAAGNGTTKVGGKKAGLAGLGRTLSLRAKMAAAATLARSGSVTPTMGSNRNRKGSFGGKGSGDESANAHRPVSMRTATISGPQPQQKRASFSGKKNGSTGASGGANGNAGSTPTKTPSRSATVTPASTPPAPPPQPALKRNVSVSKPVKHTYADVGYIPGRSFVGRVLECGWEVKDEVVRKGEWVVGLLDVRKGGALAEFIVVDRHRVHRVPNPRPAASTANSSTSTTPNGSQVHQGIHIPTPVWPTSPNATQGGAVPPTLTLEELALLPLCGLPAYRAMRTFQVALTASAPEGPPNSPGPLSPSGAARVAQSYVSNDGYPNEDLYNQSGRRRRRALVLRGHDGAGAMAVQMLVQKGWRVSVHVPLSALPNDATFDEEEAYKQSAEDRARIWGADEVIFDDGEQAEDEEGDEAAPGAGNGKGAVPETNPPAIVGGGGRGAAVRVMDSLREEGDVFDAILDTIGGKEIREAAERLLKNNLIQAGNSAAAGGNEGGGLGRSISFRSRKKPTSSHYCGQFTTLVGDVPERTIPSAADNFRAGIRALRLGGPVAGEVGGGGAGSDPAMNGSPSRKASEDEGNAPNKATGKIGYAWISVAQDIDWEGADVGETLGTVLRMALEDGVRPWVGGEDAQTGSRRRVVPFEKAPHAFVDGGPLGDGGTVVVKIAG